MLLHLPRWSGAASGTSQKAPEDKTEHVSGEQIVSQCTSDKGAGGTSGC